MSTTFGFFFLVAITIFVLIVGHSFALEQIHKNPMVELVQRQPLQTKIFAKQATLKNIEKSNSSFVRIDNPTNCASIYGAFCGPAWSRNLWWSGCYGSNVSIDYAEPLAGVPIDKVDGCCQVHDECCIRNRTSCGSCDQNIVKCLETNYCTQDTYYDYYFCKMARLMMLTFFRNRGQTCC